MTRCVKLGSSGEGTDRGVRFARFEVSMAYGRPTALLFIASALAVGACATLEGPPEEVPPEAPTPRLLWGLSPNLRDKVFPAPAAFNAREWLERLTCPVGDLPGWKQTAHKGPVYALDVECPGAAPISVELDTGGDEPAAPAPLRLLAKAGLAKYREALSFEEKREYDKALHAANEAIQLSPEEPAYRRERVYVLYALDRIPESIVEADMLLETAPSPLAWKYRALAAKALGMKQETLRSIEEILVSCDERHPLFAEAMCAKGMLITDENADEGEKWMKESCSLKHEPCCAALNARSEARLQARRAMEAARALPPMKLATPPTPSPATPSPAMPSAKTEEGTEAHETKAESRAQ